MLIRHVGTDSIHTPYLACHDDVGLDKARSYTCEEAYCCFHKDGTVDAEWEMTCLDRPLGLYLIRKARFQKLHGLLRLTTVPHGYPNNPTVGGPYQHTDAPALVDDMWCLVQLASDIAYDTDRDRWGGVLKEATPSTSGGAMTGDEQIAASG